MPERAAPTEQELESYIKDRNNWGRWGADDELGAMNLITTQKRVAAAQLVRTGRSLSLSRFIPKTPGPGNPTPAQHWMRSHKIGTGGAATDFYGMSFHGMSTTHLDALCHVWGSQGIYNGRDPDKEITFDGANFGSVDKWADGIVTRGVLVDVPNFRGEPFVSDGEAGPRLGAGGYHPGSRSHPGSGRRAGGIQRPGGLGEGQSRHPICRRTQARPSRFMHSIRPRQRHMYDRLGHAGVLPQWL